MDARRATTAFLILAAATAGFAADVNVYGRIYGAITDDFTEGSVGPELTPEPPPTESPSSTIVRDGDPTYDYRLEADVGIRAAFDDNVAANFLFTFDDRKQSKFYRYALFESEAGVYHLAEHAETKYVYGSLEQVNVELKDLWHGTDVTLGGFDIRYGHGGYYNNLVNRIDPVSFVAYLDPFGIRAGREFGSLTASLDVGAGLEHQAIAAASCRAGGFGLFFASEGMKYDLKSLWDTHYAPALPKFWRNLHWREKTLAPEPRGTLGNLGDTIHAGVETSREFLIMNFYGVVAYHRFADDESLRNPTGGMLFQVYPDFGLRLIGPRLWFRGAVLYEVWRANYESTFGDDVDTNDYLLLFGEPEFFFTENLFFGVGGRYINPGRRVPDDPVTRVRENKSLSVAALPHLSYAPKEGVKIDITYTRGLWDPSYDLRTTEFEEHRANELKLEIEAAF